MPLSARKIQFSPLRKIKFKDQESTQRHSCRISCHARVLLHMHNTPRSHLEGQLGLAAKFRASLFEKGVDILNFKLVRVHASTMKQFASFLAVTNTHHYHQGGWGSKVLFVEKWDYTRDESSFVARRG